jgi:hypothetical protein
VCKKSKTVWCVRKKQREGEHEACSRESSGRARPGSATWGLGAHGHGRRESRRRDVAGGSGDLDGGNWRRPADLTRTGWRRVQEPTGPACDGDGAVVFPGSEKF